MSLQQIVGIFLVGTILLAHVECSGFYPAGYAVPGVHGLPAVPSGIAYTRAIPYNIPPFAAAVSYYRTGPKPIFAPAPALLPPHVHSVPRYAVSAIAPHVHAAPVYPAVGHPLGLGVPAIVPHAASHVPHVGVLPGSVLPHAHAHAHLAPLPVEVPLPHAHAHAHAHAHLAPLPVPVPHAHVGPAVAQFGAAPYLQQPHPHFQSLITPHSNFHGHVDPVHYHHR